LDSEPSSLDDDVITTPTQSLRRTSAKRSRDKEDVEPATAEAESRARLVGQGWSSRWSLGSQASSSPAAAAPGGSDRKRQALPLSAAAPRILTAKNLNARGGMSYAAAVQSPLTARKTTLVVTPSRPPPKVTPSSAPAPAPASASPSIPVSRPLGMSSNALERFRYSRK
jgi:hypothetical protein